MSNVVITVDGTDISDQVIYTDATFEQQMNAIPGTCHFRVKDPDQTLSFITGQEIRLFIDGAAIWGGYLRRKAYTYPFLADDTSEPDDYINRIWELEGSDYNILWDTRIIRRTADYTSHVPDESGYPHDTMDGWAIWKLLETFSDFPSGFGITSTRGDAAFIDDIREVIDSTRPFFYKEQSTVLRAQMEDLARMAGATFYISADKEVHYHAFESVVKRWGFSDDPNYVSLTVSPDDYQDSTWGFHDVTAEEDGTMMVTDAMVWGGSPLGSGGEVLFARYQNATSGSSSTSTTYVQNGSTVGGSPLDIYGRWQVGEVHTEGGMYGNLNGVKARANVIINGPSGTSVKGETKGLSRPIWQFSFSWRAWQVPMLSGVRNHILAGDIIRIELAAFDVAQFAPCRTMRVTFENLDPSGDAYAILQGDFSYSYTDPTSLWAALLGANRAASSSNVNTAPAVTTADNTTVSVAYGAFGTFTPVETPNGVITVFTLPNSIEYISSSVNLYLNGLIQRKGTDFSETTATTITLTSAPVAADTLLITCRTLAT